MGERGEVNGVLGVVFDLDGTLIDSRRDIAAATNHALASVGRPSLEESVIASFVGDGARPLLARAAGTTEDDPAVDELLAAFLAHYQEHPLDFTTLVPGAIETLDALRPLPLAVATNKPRPTTEIVLHGLALTHRFRIVVTGSDPLPRKPAAAQLLHVAEALDLPSESLVMVGDGPQDVECGRAAGARTVGVEGGMLPPARLAAARPDAMIRRLPDLVPLLASWGAHLPERRGVRQATRA